MRAHCKEETNHCGKWCPKSERDGGSGIAWSPKTTGTSDQTHIHFQWCIHLHLCLYPCCDGLETSLVLNRHVDRRLAKSSWECFLNFLKYFFCANFRTVVCWSHIIRYTLLFYVLKIFFRKKPPAYTGGNHQHIFHFFIFTQEKW